MPDKPIIFAQEIVDDWRSCMASPGHAGESQCGEEPCVLIGWFSPAIEVNCIHSTVPLCNEHAHKLLDELRMILDA